MAGDLETAIQASRHRRRMDLGFLEICSPRIRRCWDYWTAKRGDRAMPARADIDPAEIPDLLPYIVLTEVLAGPPFLRYRLVGTAQVAVRGHDPTGQPVRGHHIGHHVGGEAMADEVMLNYRIVIERRSFVYDFNSTLGPDPAAGAARGSFGHAPVRELGTLLLPLSGDGTRVDMVFCCADIEAPE